MPRIAAGCAAASRRRTRRARSTRPRPNSGVRHATDVTHRRLGRLDLTGRSKAPVARLARRGWQRAGRVVEGADREQLAQRAAAGSRADRRRRSRTSKRRSGIRTGAADRAVPGGRCRMSVRLKIGPTPSVICSTARNASSASSRRSGLDDQQPGKEVADERRMGARHIVRQRYRSPRRHAPTAHPAGSSSFSGKMGTYERPAALR